MLLAFFFIAFWSGAIAQWHCSCCFCSYFPSPACLPHGCSLRHCFFPWQLATGTATFVFKNGIDPPCVSSCNRGSVRPCIELQCTEACRSKKKTSCTLPSVNNFLLSVLTLKSFLSCGAVVLHALAEGLALGVAAPKAFGLGQHMVLPVSLQGLPHGVAVAICIYGATDSWPASLAAAALIGFMGPISAIGAILAGIDYSGLDHVMVLHVGDYFQALQEW